MNVSGVVTTSSPGPTSKARSASSRPIVQLETATTCGAARNSASARSNVATRGPVARKSVSKVSRIDASSASPSPCSENSTRSGARGFAAALGENAAIDGDVVEGALDVGEEGVLAERVPAAIVGIDVARAQRREDLGDAVVDRARRGEVEDSPDLLERDVV